MYCSVHYFSLSFRKSTECWFGISYSASPGPNASMTQVTETDPSLPRSMTKTGAGSKAEAEEVGRVGKGSNARGRGLGEGLGVVVVVVVVVVEVVVTISYDVVASSVVVVKGVMGGLFGLSTFRNAAFDTMCSLPWLSGRTVQTQYPLCLELTRLMSTEQSESPRLRRLCLLRGEKGAKSCRRSVKETNVFYF